MPAQLLWTNSTGNGLFGTATNWTDLLGGASVVPGSADYVYFGRDGSNTACTFNLASLTVDRVVMDANYTATLTMPADTVLTTTNQFVQYGGLALAGGTTTGATINAGTWFDINGAVAATSGGGVASALSTTGDFFVNATASITVFRTSAVVTDLIIATGGFDQGGTINVGDPTTLGPGMLTITGPFLQQPGGVTNLVGGGPGGSTLTFDSAGVPGDYPKVGGTVNLDGTIVTSEMDLHGTLNVAGPNGGVIAGSVGVFNGGVINVGDATTHAGDLLAIIPGSLTTGSLTIGARKPDLPATGGTLNVYIGGVLSFPVGPAGDRFVVTSLGAVNLYGGIASGSGSGIITMGRIATMEILATDPYLAPGRLTSIDGPNWIAGSVVNNGIISFEGALSTLTIGADYTQGATGTLAMRLANSGASDILSAGGTAKLGGTLSLIAFDALTPVHDWVILVAGFIDPDFDFAVVNFPPQPGNWVWDGVAGKISN